MRASEFTKSRSRFPKKGAVAKVVGWVHICNLPIESGKLWVGDLQASWAESNGTSDSFRVEKGLYRVSAEIITFGQGYFSSRLRICLQSVRKPTVGKEVAHVGTDSATIAASDFHAMQQAYKTAFPEFDRSLEKFLFKDHGRIGVLRPNGLKGAKIPFIFSGFGDGCGPLLELKDGKKRVGFDAEFLADGYVAQ